MLKTHKELTGCECGNKAGVRITMPVTGHRCLVCGSTKDDFTDLKIRYANLKKDYATLAASHRRLVEELKDCLQVAKFDDWKKATTGRQIVFRHAMKALAEAEQLSK